MLCIFFCCLFFTFSPKVTLREYYCSISYIQPYFSLCLSNCPNWQLLVSLIHVILYCIRRVANDQMIINSSVFILQIIQYLNESNTNNGVLKLFGYQIIQLTSLPVSQTCLNLTNQKSYLNNMYLNTCF